MARHTGAMRRICTFLDRHVGQSLPRADLAAMASLGPSQFSHVFHEVVGMTLKSYLQEVKIKRAERLMRRRSSMSLAEIAAEVGFYHLPHLDKTFRRRRGMTPQAFRHRHRRPKKRDTKYPPRSGPTSRAVRSTLNSCRPRYSSMPRPTNERQSLERELREELAPLLAAPRRPGAAAGVVGTS
jgi:AraC-like DNA-binding protein